MITHKGKTIIARSLCEQINDPLAYIAVGVGKWKDSEFQQKQQLVFETARYKVLTAAPFEINQQIAIILNSNLPTPGTANIAEMGIFTAAQDDLLATNPSTSLYVSDYDGSSYSFAGGEYVIDRNRVAYAPYELKNGETLSVNIEDKVRERYHEYDIIKYGSPYQKSGHTPQITFVGEWGSLTFTTTTGSSPTSSQIQIKKQGLDAAGSSLNATENSLASYWVWGLILRPEIIAQISGLGKLKTLKIKNDDSSSLLIDSIRYESVNTYNPGYAMVAYLAVDTGIDRWPIIRKMDGEEAVISYELLISNDV
jgi:hypothetical protein